jgi:hypothetical protein
MNPTSTPPPLPSCPKCGRRIAAWKLDHCVYCGAPFPAGFRDGVPEPEALKWLERPGLSIDASKQLELMKVVADDQVKKPRSLILALTGFSIPVFGVIFYLIYVLLQRYSPPVAVAVLLGGAGFLGYLVWNAAKLRG